MGPGIDVGFSKNPSNDEAVTELVKVLDQLGFALEVSETDEDIMVLQRHCPFLEVAREHQSVVCSVHLGLMRGLLEGLAAPVVTERLIPFDGPNGCQSYLAHAPK